MKIGIITFTINNFGAQLQAYALQHKLSLLGYDAEICDVQIEAASLQIRKKAKKQEWMRSFFSRDFFRTLFRIINKLLKRVDRRLDKSGGVGFEQFKADYLVCSQIYSAWYLRENPNLYDVYIVGSDQVWSYVMSSILDVYFLNFTTKQRISYAASFGVSNIPNSLKAEYAKFLNNLDAISIREQQGVTMAKALTKNNVQKVVDPTFLLDRTEWETIFDNTALPKKEFIFIYDLIESNYLTDYVMWLSKKKSLDVISAAGKTPRQFLSLIAHAKHVVTTSFHGTALSINFGVNFTVICRTSKSTNSRMIDLCKDYGMEEHVLFEGEKFYEPNSVDFNQYSVVLNSEIQKSLDYLKRNIKIK